MIIKQHDPHAGQVREFDISFTKTRSRPRRYNIVLKMPRLKAGRVIGWVTEVGPDHWEAFADDGAFRGTGPTDVGHVHDVVPRALVREYDKGHYSRISAEPTRSMAASSLLWWLLRQQAPAVGFGRHPDVKAWGSTDR